IITRLIAIVPALVTVIYFGDRATGELLVLSQVVLSLQLGFAVIPLIHFVSDKEKMGKFAIGTVTKIASWTVALVIVALNVKLVYDEIGIWVEANPNATYIWIFVVPIALGSVGLLFYIMFKPLLDKRSRQTKLVPHIEEVIFAEEPEMLTYKN